MTLDTEIKTEEVPVNTNVNSNYAFFGSQFDELTKAWVNQVTQARVNRSLRSIDIDTRSMRAQGVLKEGETLLPVRIADRNIRREQPQYISFLTQSRRSLLFRSAQGEWDKGINNEERLEAAFTQGMRCQKWEVAPFKATDGAQTHGWDSVEVVFDDTKPLKVGIEHIGNDKLMFPPEAIDLQFCEYICRGYDLTTMQLQMFVTQFGFDAVQVEQLISPDKQSGKSGLKHYRVWKVMFREDGIIKVAWRCDAGTNSASCNDWLKKPENLYLGRQHKEITVIAAPPEMVHDQFGAMTMVQPPPIETEVMVDDVETEFPVYVLQYHETENQRIFETKGRVFLDKYDQEAQTAIASGFVNGLMRATNVYASVRNDGSPGSSAPPKQLNVKMEHGAIYDKPVDFFHSDYPNPVLLSALQYFDVRNSDENGQTNFAVNNRQDSRKTATEIQAANQQAGLLSAVQVTLYSSWVCSFYSRAWEIVQSLALADKIKFLPLVQPDGTTINDKVVIDKPYYTKAAGDVDVIQRAETLGKMQQFWPLLQGTAAAPMVLRTMLVTAFPDGGIQWSQAIQDDNNTKQLLATVSQMLEQLIAARPEELAQLPPEQQQQLASLQQQVQQVINPQNANA